MAYSFSNTVLDGYSANLIHAWNLKETAGTRPDLVGSLDLTDNNSVLSSYGKQGRCADFERNNSEYLNNSSDFSAGLAQLSFSFWMRLESLPSSAGQYFIIFREDTGTSGYARCLIAINTSNQLWIGMRDTETGSIIQATSSNTFSANTWYHIVVIFDTTNDVQLAYVNTANWINYSITMGAFSSNTSATGLNVGGISTNPSNYFDGMLDEVYIWDTALSSTAVGLLYNSGAGNFYLTPSERLGNDELTVLLLHCNGTDGSTTFTDSSQYGHSFTATGDAQIDTAQSKFGGASGLFDGSGDIITTADSDDWAFGTANFTIDFWIRFADVSGERLLFRQYADSSNYWYIRKNTGGNIDFNWVAQGSGKAYYASSGFTFSNDTWYHIQFSRNGSGALLFINGNAVTLTSGVAFGSNDVGNVSALLYIGANNPPGEYFYGWMDEIRISKGICRNTTSFTPSSREYGESAEFNEAGTNSLGMNNIGSSLKAVVVAGTNNLGFSGIGYQGVQFANGIINFGFNNTGRGNMNPELAGAVSFGFDNMGNGKFDYPVDGAASFGFNNLGTVKKAYPLSAAASFGFNNLGTGKQGMSVGSVLSFDLSNIGDGVVATGATFAPVFIPQPLYKVENYRYIGDPGLMIGRQ